MVDPDGTPRFEFILPDNLMSRGTGEIVDLREAVALDLMPQILGSQFETVGLLRDGVHLHGQHTGPYMDMEEAYTTIAKDALAKGWTYIALDAYRRALHYSLQWTQGLSTMRPGFLLLDQAQIDHLAVGAQFASLEQELARAVWSDGDFSFNPDSYSAFVREVRAREDRLTRLGMLFEYGEDISLPEGSRAVLPRHNPGVGREYVDLAVQMRHFDTAVRVAKKLGWEEEVAIHAPEAQAMSDDRWARSLIEGIQMRREIDEWRGSAFET